MNDVDTVAVIGLGLIGGSIARDLAARGVRVAAYDVDAASLAAAVQSGVVATPLDESLAGVAEAQVVVVAVPVDSAGTILWRLAPYASGARLITDVGSTKARIVAEAARLPLRARFVGSHPMAGDHLSGWAASRRDLFRDAPVYLCATAEASEDAVALAHALWTQLGGRPALMSAIVHDRQLAWTSHLPHFASSAVALALARTGIAREDLGPGGREVTRLAGSSPGMWTAIARENATEIDAALAAAAQEIARFREALGRRDGEQLQKRFAAAQDWFNR